MTVTQKQAGLLVENYPHDERSEAYKTVVRLNVTSVTRRSCWTSNGNVYSYGSIWCHTSRQSV